MKILLLEDDVILNEIIEEFLLSLNYDVITAFDGNIAEELIYEESFDLLLFDVNIPNITGFELLKNIRQNNINIPIIFITSRHTADDVKIGFNSGCDDYIKKPFDFDILLARIEARLRFGGTNIIEIDDLIINPDEEKIEYAGEEIELKGKPFEVLTHLARHRDQIVSKEQLLDAIWEEPELVTPNVIEVAINQIRQKMDKPLNISTIETIRRRGYRFCYPNQVEEK